mgnify:CR=1 FL=1
MNQVRIFALGGLDEDGKNMYVVEVGQSIFVIEAGLKYPDNDQHGIEMIIPDVRYLVENKHRVKGIFITHGHDDVMAAIANLVRQVNAPIYTAPLTALLIEDDYESICDEIWYIHTDVEKRIQRLMSSRGYTREKAVSIINNQASEEFFRSHADCVIENNGDLEETHCQIAKEVRRNEIL